MTDDAKAVEIANQIMTQHSLDRYHVIHEGEFLTVREITLAKAFLALSEKCEKMQAVVEAAEAGLLTMKCQRFGHQDNVCPKCLLECAIDELEPGDSDG